MMHKKFKLWIVVAILIFVGVCGLYAATKPSADEVLKDFYTAEGRAEDMLMDPLILHADIVAPLVITEIKNPEMNKRRYAIGFLGNERINEALPVLRSILSNEKEKDYFRADSLVSIFMIDKNEGLALANKYSVNKDFLGHVARGLLDGCYHLFKRSYWQALVGRHE